MGKKKDKHGGKHREGGRHAHHEEGRREDGGGRHGGFPAPLAGIAAMVTQQVTRQLQSPATRAAMASGLRAAADALTRMQTAVPPAPTPPVPVPPVPPQPAAAPEPPVAPAAGAAPQGTTKSPDPQAIAGAIEDAAKLVLGRLFAAKK